MIRARKTSADTLSAGLRAFLAGEPPPAGVSRDELLRIRNAFLLPRRPTLVEELMTVHGASLPPGAWGHLARVPRKLPGQLIAHPFEREWLDAARAAAPPVRRG